MCRGKERQAFSVTLVFEVKILWTGLENIFPRSLLKVHILPSQKWSFDQKKSLSLYAAIGSDAETVDSYSPPDGIASKHPWAGQPHTHQISNQIQIHEVSLVVCERVSRSIHRTSSRQWRRVSRKRSFRAAWLLNEGKIKMILKQKKKNFLLFSPLLWVGPGKCVCLLVVKRISVSYTHAHTLLPVLSFPPSLWGSSLR